jgi:predicted nuclease with TOPRIM domain
MMWEQALLNLGGGGAIVAVLLAGLRSVRFRSFIARGLSDTSEIKQSLNSLRDVVLTQGESIEWLRTELTRTRAELELAREQLKNTESLRIENVHLRARVAELELHVARLEAQLKDKY